jgi:hypothetical protein
LAEYEEWVNSHAAGATVESSPEDKPTKIRVTIDEPCRQLMAAIGITEEQVSAAVNSPDQGMRDDAFTRITVSHWVSDQEIVVVETFVTKKDSREVEKGLWKVYLHEVVAKLAIKVQPVLPAGVLTRNMEMQEALRLIAGSFGVPVTCHPEQPTAALYTGPWDGKPCRTEPVPVASGQPVLMLGTLWSDRQHGENVWAFSPAKYLEWFRGRGPGSRPGS